MKIKEKGCYHIFNRGNNRGPIFFNDRNYCFFIEQFCKYVGTYVEVYAFCLMPNHFHFSLKVLDKINFEKEIKNFFISYVKSINKEQDRVGSLFQGRYKAVEITSNHYFENLIRYIHQNPIAAKLANSLADYEYSSYKDYIDEVNGFICKPKVLSHFGGLQNFIDYHSLELVPS